MPNDKPDIAAATAMAGEFLGMKVMYLDAGSGAQNPVSQSVIKAVNENTNCILFVGGGIKSVSDAKNAWSNGADYIVVGNGIFDNTQLLSDLCIEMNQIISTLINQ
jgi:putative glycerol-1-phosphate prenyltransferase